MADEGFVSDGSGQCGRIFTPAGPEQQSFGTGKQYHLLWRRRCDHIFVLRLSDIHVLPAHRCGKASQIQGRIKKGDRGAPSRSEEHTSGSITNAHLVCRLLLEKKKKRSKTTKKISSDAIRDNGKTEDMHVPNSECKIGE